jgi:N-acetylmuramoyl-L-alanine amidase
MNRKALIISGHVQEPASKIDQKGAQSYTGIFEHEFNDAVVGYFEDKFHQISGIRYDVIKASGTIELQERVEYANRIMPALYLEIHHDATQTWRK